MASSNNIDPLLLNLTLCDIMVSLASASTLQMDSDWLDMIRTFVAETLQNACKLNCKQLNRLLGVTWRLLQIQRNKGKISLPALLCNKRWHLARPFGFRYLLVQHPALDQVLLGDHTAGGKFAHTTVCCPSSRGDLRQRGSYNHHP